MKALLWKKVKEIKRNKVKLLAALMLPIIMLGWMLILKINFKYIVSYFPLMVILLDSVILFSIEDFVFAEVILCTNIKIKDIWGSNIIFLNLIGYVYSNILILLSVFLCKYIDLSCTINYISIIQNLSCILVGIGFLAFSTVHVSSYSYFRQILGSIGAIINIMFFIAPMVYPKVFLFYDRFSLVILLAAMILFVISYLIVTFLSKTEELIKNLQSLNKTYKDTQTIDE